MFAFGQVFQPFSKEKHTSLRCQLFNCLHALAEPAQPKTRPKVWPGCVTSPHITPSEVQGDPGFIGLFPLLAHQGWSKIQWFSLNIIKKSQHIYLRKVERKNRVCGQTCGPPRFNLSLWKPSRNFSSKTSKLCLWSFNWFLNTKTDVGFVALTGKYSLPSCDVS